MLKINVARVLTKVEQKRSQIRPQPKIRIITKDKVPQKSISIQSGGKSVLTEAELIIHDLWNQYGDIMRERARLSSSMYETVYGRKSAKSTDIGTVLNKIDTLVDQNGSVRTFGLRFLTENGASEMTSCRKNVKSPKQRTNGHEERGKFRYNLQKKGTILLSAPDKPYRSVLVSTIYEFLDFNSQQWIAIRH